MRVSMLVFVVALVGAGALFVRANGLPPDRSAAWGRYQAAAVTLLGDAGLYGALRPDLVWIRIAFALLAVAAVVRLVLLPGQVRRRSS